MIDKLLILMAEKSASDLFITAGVPPSIKINGSVTPVSRSVMSADQVKEIVYSLMNDAQQEQFETEKELNFAVNATGVGRFRGSAFFQRNVPGVVLRRIETKIPSIDQLKLPSIIKDLSMTKRGLILLVGATGAGKSTSLAAIIGHRNKHSQGHILSIEDPIEFIHKHEGCIVTQREVGLDTDSFEIALKNALRQAPDAIMIGEVRTSDTMNHAITFSETGHLCLATLHANNANQALERVIHFFPPERHPQIWMDLSLNLRAIVAQQLVPSKDGKGRRAVFEILLNTPLVADVIRKGDVSELKDLMNRSTELGMTTFDQSLLDLYQKGEISYENAMSYADSANDLRIMIKLGSDIDYSQLSGTSKGFTLQD